ncbi:MAG: hypothetical protein ABIR98_03670 [Usitatibacter sp.]
MKTILRHFATVAALLAVPAVASDAIAFFTNLKGEVTVDGNARPLLLSELAKGQRIAVGRDSLVSVMYIATGKEYVLKGPADYQVKDAEISGSTPMPPTVRSTEWRASNKVLVQVAQTSAASVRMRSLAKPKDDVAPRLLYPTEGSIATLQPTFRWRAEDTKQSGELTLHAVGEAKTLHAAKAAGGSYRLPIRLKPDTEYAWTYAVAGNEIGSGHFRTVSADAIQQVEKRRPSDKAEFSDRLLFTLMLYEMGAAQEARESWGRLSRERSDLPELSALAK